MDLYKYIPKNQFRYYYSALSAHEKEIYDLMLISLMNRENAFVLPETNINSAFKIYNLIKYDVPETFFVKTIFAMMSATGYKKGSSYSLAVCDVICFYFCPIHKSVRPSALFFIL